MGSVVSFISAAFIWREQVPVKRSERLLRGMIIVGLFAIPFDSFQIVFAAPSILWYTAPATDWQTQSLPIGNGYIGGTVFGGVTSECVQFNEHTLWTGGPGSTTAYTGNNPTSSKLSVITNMRVLCEQENYSGANSAASGIMAAKVGFGAYQTFGDIYLDCSFPSTTYTAYRRELDLDSALAKVRFTINNVIYYREFFVSYPDRVMTMRLTANQAQSITVTLRFTTPQAGTITTNAGRLQLAGSLTNNRMAFEAQCKVTASGGTLATNASTIAVTNADTVTILVAAGTDYSPVYPTYKGANPHAQVTATLDSALNKPYAVLKTNHIRDYQKLFGAVTIDLNQAPPAQATDAQLTAYKTSGNNRALEALFFQYGRYMLIACSRPGTLPANLQGMWNNSTSPSWGADYHVNINLQMNYWCADVTNIGETMLPLVDWLNMNRPNGRNTAQLYFGAQGWCMGNELNIFGFTGFHDWFESFYFPLSNAWMCHHLWDHYAFYLDTSYLRDQAYPIMKESAQFLASYLTPDANDNSRLVSNPSYSPEHGNFTQGSSGDQQFAWDLLTNTIQASNILNIDSAFRQTLVTTKSRLDPGLRIGSWGQLQEWKPNLDNRTEQHRHVTHLFALFPGNQINPYTDVQYVNAVRTSLTALGDNAEGTGWGRAWRSALWARLFDGNHAYTLYRMIMQNNISANLWDIYPPFQIDANLGAVAAFAEMLLQSQTGIVYLLPALPSAWPTGSVMGLRARGNRTVNITWSQSRITRAEIIAGTTDTCRVKQRVGPHLYVINQGQNYPATYSGDTAITFYAVAGQTYVLLPQPAGTKYFAGSVNDAYTGTVRINGRTIVVSGLRDGWYTLTMTTLNGKKVLVQRFAGSSARTIALPMKKPAPGVYLVQIASGRELIKKKIAVGE